MIHPTEEHPLVLDVTVRDGGYVIDHRWTPAEAAAIVRTTHAAGVDLIEVGYLRSGEPDPLRPSATCAPAYLDLLAEQVGWSRLVVMVRPGEVEPTQVAAVARRGVGLVRVLVPYAQAARALPLVAAARSAGAPVSMNITRISEKTPAALAETVLDCAAAGADVVYLADSNGGLFPEDVRARVTAAVGATTVPIGFHAHDNLSMAFANTLVALEAGATMIDASLGGIGKGGGNLRLELLTAHWVLCDRAEFRLEPLVQERTAVAAQLRMLADAGSTPFVSGLLNVNLDGIAAFQRDVAVRGVDAVLREATLLRRDGAELAQTV